MTKIFYLVASFSYFKPFPQYGELEVALPVLELPWVLCGWLPLKRALCGTMCKLCMTVKERFSSRPVLDLFPWLSFYMMHTLESSDSYIF